MRDVSQITYDRGVDVSTIPARCICDGAMMELSIEAFQPSLDEAPYPVYVFDCPVCENTGEIS